MLLYCQTDNTKHIYIFVFFPMGVVEHDTDHEEKNNYLKNPPPRYEDPPPRYENAFKYTLVSETCRHVAISSPTTTLLSVDACPFFPRQSPPPPPPRVSAEMFTLDAVVAAAARPAEIATPPFGSFIPHFVATMRENRVLYKFQKKADFRWMFAWTEEMFSFAFELATKQKQKNRLDRTYQLWRVYMANPRS